MGSVKSTPARNSHALAKKGVLHPRNRHLGQYDFPELMKTNPKLAKFVSPNHAGVSSIDFANPEAVICLNQALLKKFYGIETWDLPANYLCPPVPGRADYIHYAADLLAEASGGIVSSGSEIKVLDIGTGANCIYPIIGTAEYGWSFVASDSDAGAFESASKIVKLNAKLKDLVELRFQAKSEFIFKGVVKPSETFALSVCNPPFHASQAEADGVSARKWGNLGKATVANFGGRNHELWCEGGEVAFISKMIEESQSMPKACLWFTSLVSKEASLGPLYGKLRAAKVSVWKTIEMAQGQKKSRFVAWSFTES